MKTIKNLVMVSLFALLVMNCKNEVNPEVKTIEVATEASNPIDANANYAKAEFTIDGMTCAVGCAATIQKKIAKMDGVKSATVDFDRKLAMVEYDEAKVTPTLLEETVTKVSDIYKVSNMKTIGEFSSKKVCDKACCEGKTDAEKATCKMDCCSKSDSVNKPMVCESGCKKACCTKKV